MKKSKKAIRLDKKSMQQFQSNYLIGGYKDDTFEILFAEIGGEYIKAKVRMNNYFLSPDTGEFHLAVPIAMCILFQLAIFYGCVDRKLSAKSGESYLRSLDIKCKREITKTEFEVKLTQHKCRDVGDTTFYFGDFSFDDGAFHGKSSFVLAT